MADFDQTLLITGNGYYEERIAKTNSAVVMAPKTGEAAVQGGGTKETRGGIYTYIYRDF